MLKGLIFDMDGTLTLTEPLHHKAFAWVFNQYGVEYTFEESVKKYAGAGSKYTFQNVFDERGIVVTDEQIAECVAKKHELYKKLVQEAEVPVVNGVIDFVEKTDAAGLKRVIATGNSDLDAVRSILKRVGLLEYFPAIVSISEVPHGKPAPDVFLEAARRIDCAPDECIVFEDAINGVKGARAADIPCIAIETSFTSEDLLAAGATYTVKDYTFITDKMLYEK